MTAPEDCPRCAALRTARLRLAGKVEELTMDLIEVSAERDMLEQQLGVLRQELHALRAGQAQALQQAPIS